MHSGFLNTAEYSSCLAIRRPALWEPFEDSVAAIAKRSAILIYEGMLGMGGKWFINEARRAIQAQERTPLLTGDDILQGQGGGIFFAEYFPMIREDRRRVFFRALETLLSVPGTLVVISQNMKGYEPQSKLYRACVRKVTIPPFDREETKNQLARLRFSDTVPVHCLTGGNPWVNSLIALLGPEQGIDYAYEQLMGRLPSDRLPEYESVIDLYSALEEKELPLSREAAAVTLGLAPEAINAIEQTMAGLYYFNPAKGERHMATPLRKIVLAHLWQKKDHHDGWKLLTETVKRYEEEMEGCR